MLELILGALLLAPYARRRHWLAVALVFHAGIVLVHGLSSFFCAMAAGVLLYLRPYAEPIRWLTGFRWRANSWVRRLAEPVKG